MFIDCVEPGMHNLEITGQAKDGGKNNFEVPSAWKKVKEIEVPKAKGEEEGLQSQG
jgi:hypothetical protein